jgi:glycosyltransferase involved in cell wall biosynthesis
MKDFERFAIQHLPLENLEKWAVPAGNHFVVIWQGAVPLGHCWIEKDRIPDSNTLKHQFSKSIQPALKFYINLQNPASPGEWLQWLESGAFTALSKVLAPAMAGTSPDSTSQAKGVSVIVCTHNRSNSLLKCISSLMQSTDPDFECIVVDNAPSDELTLETVRQFPGVRYVRELRKGLDIARNTGVRNATREIIAFADDDVEVDPGWIVQLKNSFADPLTMAITGQVFPIELETRSQYIFERYWGFNKGYVPTLFDRQFYTGHLKHGVPVWDIGAGANMAFRKEVFDLVGLFDERLEAGAAGCSGDSEFWYRVLAEGWNCRYLPSLIVYHRHRRTPEELRRQLYLYARGHACALMVQYEKYRNKGELTRFFRLLPKAMLQRAFAHLKHSHWRNLGSVWREARGTAAGWLYYYRSGRDPGYSRPFLPAPHLRRDNTPGMESLVSVIIPCFNHGSLLSEAIRSAESQSYPVVEIVVVDDGSTENIQAICEPHSGVRYIRTGHVGVSAARNLGIACSKGDFLVFLDADDILYPDAISTNLQYFKKMPWLAYVSGGHDKIDSHGNLLPSEGPYDKPDDNYCSLLLGNYIGMQSNVMYRRELFFSFHFDPSLRAAEDYDLNLEIARYYPVLGHAEKIAAYRIHDLNTSRDLGMMLHGVLKVLDRQKKNLRNEREKEALNKGKTNWKKYYTS